MDFRTADLCDEFSQTVRVCELELRSYGGAPRFCGPISTVRVYEDNVLVKEAIQSVPKGSVLVVDGGGSRRCALVGGNLGKIAAERELAGIVIFGAVRDTLELAEHQVGVLALGSNPRRSTKAGVGTVGEPVRFGGTDFFPGQYVYADEDGLVVSERALL